MSIELWTLVIATLTSVTCALSGSLLLVNRQAMLSEGLSHAVLPGMVIAFMIIREQSSPLLIVAAAASGLVMVWLTNWLERTQLVDGDAGLGIVFAGMFSVGVLLVSQNLRNTHFHAECIIDGNLALAPLNRLRIGDYDFGPQSAVVMGGMLLISLAFVTLCYKELKLAMFEPTLARRFGLKPALLRFLLVSIVSLTTVAAFDVAGSVLIVALMIAPPAAAYLLSDRLGGLMLASCLIATVSSIAGFYLGFELDISPTGPMASMSGMVFLVVFAFAPKRGLFSAKIRRWRQRRTTFDRLILSVLAEGRDDEQLRLDSHSLANFGFPPRLTRRRLNRLHRSGFIVPTDNGFALTRAGQAVIARGQLARKTI